MRTHTQKQGCFFLVLYYSRQADDLNQKTPLKKLQYLANILNEKTCSSAMPKWKTICFVRSSPPPPRINMLQLSFRLHLIIMQKCMLN